MVSKIIYLRLGILVLGLLFVKQGACQRSQYFSWLSEQQLDNSYQFNPSVFASSDGGFFVTDESIRNAIIVRKFDRIGNAMWQNEVNLDCEGIHVIAMKESYDGNLYLLTQTYFSRHDIDAMLFKLDRFGNEIYHRYATPDSVPIGNFPVNMIINDSIITLYGLHSYITKAYWYNFITTLTIEGTILEYQSYKPIGYSLQNLQLLSQNDYTYKFLTLITDSGQFIDSEAIGTFNISATTKQFEFCSIIDSANITKCVFPPEYSHGQFNMEYMYYNIYDSTLLIIFTALGQLSNQFVFKFNNKGQILIRKVFFNGSPPLNNVIGALSSFFALSKDSIKAIGLISDENAVNLAFVSFDAMLNETGRIPLFTETIEFSTFLKQEKIELISFIGGYESLGRNNFVGDKEGNIIFCIEASNLNRDGYSHILIVKLNSNGEIISLKAANEFSNETFNFYPNPCTKILTINLDNNDYYLRIRNTQGYLMNEVTTYGITNLNVAELIPGFYILEVQAKNNATTLYRKFSKF